MIYHSYNYNAGTVAKLNASPSVGQFDAVLESYDETGSAFFSGHLSEAGLIRLGGMVEYGRCAGVQ